MEERLQKILSGLGTCSRRQAEQWIQAGRVRVNGQIAVLGQRVDQHGIPSLWTAPRWGRPRRGSISCYISQGAM